jgi:hypothetical protein
MMPISSAATPTRCMCELIAAPDDPQAKAISIRRGMLIDRDDGRPQREGEARQDRWMHVMASVIELVRHESSELKRTGAQRS